VARAIERHCRNKGSDIATALRTQGTWRRQFGEVWSLVRWLQSSKLLCQAPDSEGKWKRKNGPHRMNSKACCCLAASEFVVTADMLWLSGVARSAKLLHQQGPQKLLHHAHSPTQRWPLLVVLPDNLLRRFTEIQVIAPPAVAPVEQWDPRSAAAWRLLLLPPLS
jgi:hypothetical protein